MFLGFLILLAMLAGMIIQSWNEKTISYYALSEKMYASQEKIDALQTKLILQERNVVIQPVKSTKK